MIALYLTEGNSLSKVCFEKFVTFFQVCWVLEILTSIFLKVGNKIVVMFFKKKIAHHILKCWSTFIPQDKIMDD